jgi:hypothetical protein
MDEYNREYSRLSLEGHIVLTVGCLPECKGHNVEDKQKLDALHLRKIDMSDEIFVINVFGYVGQSTHEEIAYAVLKRKVVRYLEPTVMDALNYYVGR